MSAPILKIRIVQLRPVETLSVICLLCSSDNFQMKVSSVGSLYLEIFLPFPCEKLKKTILLFRATPISEFGTLSSGAQRNCNKKLFRSLLLLFKYLCLTFINGWYVNFKRGIFWETYLLTAERPIKIRWKLKEMKL
jgi:hypothetical protein